MSKMKDIWGDPIEVDAEDGRVFVSFTELIYAPPREANMELDAALARKLIKKLKKALDEMEGM